MPHLGAEDGVRPGLLHHDGPALSRLNRAGVEAGLGLAQVLQGDLDHVVDHAILIYKGDPGALPDGDLGGYVPDAPHLHCDLAAQDLGRPLGLGPAAAAAGGQAGEESEQPKRQEKSGCPPGARRRLHRLHLCLRLQVHSTAHPPLAV